MIEGLLITDDLTGANASGILIKNRGIPISTILDRELCKKESSDDSSMISYSTNSRGLSSREAYEKVYDAFKYYSSPNIKLYGKRIDSTMRGNIGAEIDAALDALSDDDRLAVVVPSYPDAGRISIGDLLIVNGDLLEECDAVKDPKMPVATSNIISLINDQSSRSVKSIEVNDMRYNREKVKQWISHWYREGIRIIVFNAIKNSDLKRIAELIAELKIPILSVDPGPFTAEMADEIFSGEKKKGEGKILLAVGSMTETTSRQLESLYASHSVLKVSVDEKSLLGLDEERLGEIKRAASETESNIQDYSILCITTNTQKNCEMVNLQKISQQRGISCEELSEIINTGLAQIVERILVGCKDFKSIFCSGGDTTIAIARILKASRLNIEKEVMPLVVFGTLEGGKRPGINILSKGGMIGSEDTISECVKFLLSGTLSKIGYS